jgi:hypothetical protein
VQEDVPYLAVRPAPELGRIDENEMVDDWLNTLRGDVRESTPRDYSGTLDWTLITHEFDVPPNTYQVWVWFLYDAPVDGKLWWDDVSLEVVGAAKSAGMEPMHPLPDH